MQKLSVVIPSLNEYKYLIKNLTILKEKLKKRNVDTHIIVMDNGSTDGSKELVEKMGIEFHVNSYATIGKLRNDGVKYALSDFVKTQIH